MRGEEAKPRQLHVGAERSLRRIRRELRPRDGEVERLELRTGNEAGTHPAGDVIRAILSQEAHPREGTFNAHIPPPAQNLKANLTLELVSILSCLGPLVIASAVLGNRFKDIW